MRKLSLILGVISLIFLAACGSTGDTKSKGNVTDTDSKELKLAHNMSEDHPIHTALNSFAEKVEEQTDGTLVFEIYPNGILGSESEVLEQVQNGSVDITKVSAGALESYSDDYSVFSLPYLFTSDEHYRNVMESDIIDSVYQSTEDSGFIGLSYFDSGARSFYTKDTPINTPDDLNGQLIRVMDNNTSIQMIELLGGTPTPLAYNEIYTALQQGVIDGAESNPTALTTGQHGEVTDYFSFTEHTNIPDIVVVNSETWDSLTDDQKSIFEDVATEAREEHTELWNQAIADAIEEAAEMGVEFNKVEKEPFIEAVQPLHEEYSKNERLEEIINAINEKDG